MTPSTGSPASVPPPAAEGHALPKAPLGLDLENLKTGSRWRGLYQIGEQLPDVTYGRLFHAQHIALMIDVVVRVFKVRDDIRGRTWEAIKRAQNGDMLEFIDAVESDGRRIEVLQAPPRLTLRELSTRKKITPVEVALIVKQLAETIGNLHKNGVVHLNLRPDAIYIRATEGGLTVVLGGFEPAQLIEGEGTPAEVSVDPFYAPPEVVGLFNFPREPSLRSWDWWSLGRVMQEVVLGKHILGHMLERDVTRETPELRARAENLLKEENQMVRAGAVEMMPALDRETNTLLRGLLTGSRDGRWGLAEINAWLRKEPVTERYNLAKNERLFIWKDRAFTIAEAAEYFASLQHWHEGQENLFEPTNVATLAYFILKTGTHKKTKERFELLMKLIDAPELQHLPPDIARDVLMALILKFLAGHQAPLQLRGSKIDESYIMESLSPAAQPLGLAYVFGFLAHAIVQQVDQLDAETGRMLGEIARIHEATMKIAEQPGWIPNDDAVQMALLVSLCMKAEPVLAAERTELQKRYACTRDLALDRLFRKAAPTHAELVVIVFTKQNTQKYQYVTHREWNEEQHRVLRLRGEQLSAACTWLNLGVALRLGPLIFGRFRFIAPIWLLTASAVAIVWQNTSGYIMAVVCPLLVVAGRLFGHRVHRDRLKSYVQEDRPWTLRSGWWHCRYEAMTLLQATDVPGPKALLRFLKETNEQIVKLDLDPKPEAVARPLRFRDTTIAALVSSLLILAVIGVSTRQAILHPPKLPEVSWATITKYFSSENKPDKATGKPQLSLQQAPAGGLKSMQSSLDELRHKKRDAGDNDVKISWPFKTPVEPHIVTIQETLIAVPEQDAVANEFGTLLLDHYEPSTIKDLVAVQVPVEKGFGLMLFNGRIGKLAGKKVYVIAYLPINKSWLDLDSNKVIFLNGQ